MTYQPTQEQLLKFLDAAHEYMMASTMGEEGMHEWRTLQHAWADTLGPEREAEIMAERRKKMGIPDWPNLENPIKIG